MKQKNFKAVKHRLAEYASNLCVVCSKNETCTLPLHGKFSAKGEPCSQAEELPAQDALMVILKNVYGLSPEKCAAFWRKMYE